MNGLDINKHLRKIDMQQYMELSRTGLTDAEIAMGIRHLTGDIEELRGMKAYMNIKMISLLEVVKKELYNVSSARIDHNTEGIAAELVNTLNRYRMKVDHALGKNGVR